MMASAVCGQNPSPYCGRVLGDDASEFLGGIVRLIAQDRSVHLGSPLAIRRRLRTASALDRSELGGVEAHRDNAATKTPSSGKCITGDTV
jgi:hypothetical protein